jgi:signal transduction histidine kinase
MASGPYRVLIADDSMEDRELIRRSLAGGELPFAFEETASLGETMEACQRQAFDCTILDYRFGSADGLAALALLRERLPDMPVVIVTGQGDEVVAAKAMMAGAADYIPKTRITRTAMKRVVENAIEKAAMQRKIAEQQDSLANFNRVLAHDLKAPLSAITGFAALLRQALPSGDVQNCTKLCGRIENASRRMSALIDTLRNYSRSGSQVTFEEVAMAQVLEDALANLSQVIEERHAEVASGDLPVVTGNAPLLTNVLQNLIANSIKFCKAERPQVHVSASLEGNRWRFAAKDNGVGIPQEFWKPIFEPFTRLDTRGEFEGTGLGLATCKKIIERHQGTIWCESAPGEGTTMHFTLPIVDRVQPPTAHAAPLEAVSPN